MTWLRSHKITIGLALGVLVVVVLLGFTGGSTRTTTGSLDPQNPHPDGTRALAQVLGRHHVEVKIARGERALENTLVDSETTVLVTSADELSHQTTGDLLHHVQDAGTVVVADPPADELAAFGFPGSPTPVADTKSSPADCSASLFKGLHLAARGASGFRADNQFGSGCFPGKGSDGHSVDRLWRSNGPGETWLLGSPEVLTNRRILDADNAAVAMRLLGQHDRLVWYVADVTDVPTGDSGSVSAQLPRWLTPGLWLVLVAVVATMLWRGRRLGRIVFEPLPVVVKGIESTLSRGRLYRKVHDRDHAASILRRATRRRLLDLLRLPADLSAERLVSAVARRTERDPGALTGLLFDGSVASDDQLTTLARELADLEKEVRQS